MPKGFYSQCVCLLTDGQTRIEDVKTALQNSGFEAVKDVPAAEDWCFGGPSTIISYRPEVNGYVAVDLVNHFWPDEMGDPTTAPTLFGAWALGQFGPFTFPGGLARAKQHAWAWPPAKFIADTHRGFIRMRSSYGFGADGDAPVLPSNNDPIDELCFLSRAVLAVLSVPGVICYFNPNGEVLRDRASFAEPWDSCERQETFPLSLWTNVRYFNLSDALSLMDTVGNAQLDIADIEAIFPKSKYDPREVDYHMRNVSHYLLDSDREMKAGDPIDGPGESNLSWTIDVSENGIVQPPRRILRLFPSIDGPEIRAAIESVARTSN